MQPGTSARPVTCTTPTQRSRMFCGGRCTRLEGLLLGSGPPQEGACRSDAPCALRGQAPASLQGCAAGLPCYPASYARAFARHCLHTLGGQADRLCDCHLFHIHCEFHSEMAVPPNDCTAVQDENTRDMYASALSTKSSICCAAGWKTPTLRPSEGEQVLGVK